MNAHANVRSLADVAEKPTGLGSGDIVISMFSAQGFALAQRLANAYMSSNAVPAPFRSVNVKREKQGNDYVDVEVPNPNAMGNCLVAIETAQAIGMSITAVMQNANIIEGRLTWSGKFVIAAINASGRFHPLRFDLVNRGVIKATYKEKGAWNREQRKYDMIDREVEVENLVCVAWTLPRSVPMPNNVSTLAQAKAAQLPVIESAPVSIKMAVEEGWYSKPGSKWQTEMKYQMLQYRAGSFFGNIHAPDVVMGMGRTTEEMIDTIDVVPQADGSLAADINALRTEPSPQTAQKRANADATDVEPSSPSSNEKASAETTQQHSSAQHAGPLTFNQITDRISSAKTVDELENIRPLIREVPDPEAEASLLSMLQAAQTKLKPARAARGARPSVE